MPKYTIDLSKLSIRFLDAGGFRNGGSSSKNLPSDLKATVFNLITAVATEDLMIVQCFEPTDDVPVFLLCAFIDSNKYGGSDKLIPLCELTHPADLLECIRPPRSLPRDVFVIPSDEDAVGEYNAVADANAEPQQQQQQQHEDHSKHTKH